MNENKLIVGLRETCIVSNKKLKKPSKNMLVSLHVRCDYIGIAYNTSFLISHIELLY